MYQAPLTTSRTPDSSVDEKVVRWLASSLQERYTMISIDGFVSDSFNLTTGLPQASPFSPILYLFYTADLIDQCNQTEDTTAAGFIDDIVILACGNTMEETCNKLQEALEGAEQWALKYASVFAPDKFQLTHFIRAITRINTSLPLQTPWGEVPASPTCKYLGLIMDASSPGNPISTRYNGRQQDPSTL